MGKNNKIIENHLLMVWVQK